MFQTSEKGLTKWKSAVGGTASKERSLLSAAGTYAGKLTSYLLPAGYPGTVASAYPRYAGWSFVAMAFSSAGGVLSMQSLLFAVGVGSGSVPLAAALNWVIKDGLGQLGCVLYAALINTRFDSDPKRWRMISAMASDAATALEVLTPLFPKAFLPMAAVANIGKNIAWLSASATKAGLHQALATHGNLADVTGKAGSQNIAASTIGTLIAVLLSPLVGTDTWTLLGAFSVISACHISCIYMSLKSLPLPTLNHGRLALAVAPALEQAIADNGLSDEATAVDSDAIKSLVLSPADVNTHDAFFPFKKHNQSATLKGSSSALHNAFECDIIVGPSLSSFPVDASDARAAAAERLATSLSERRYAVGVDSANGVSRVSIQLVYAADATWKHVLTGYLHCLVLQRALSLHPGDHHVAATTADRVIGCYADALVSGLEVHGWWVGTPLIEDAGHARRIKVVVTSADRDSKTVAAGSETVGVAPMSHSERARSATAAAASA